MSDLRSRLLAAVKGNRIAQDIENAGSRCDSVTAFNSLDNSGVTSSLGVTRKLSSENIAVTPAHLDPVKQPREKKNSNSNVTSLREAHGRALAALRQRCPELVDPSNWQEAITDAVSFLDQWGDQAAVLGWTTRDLLGLTQLPYKPAPNYRRLSRYDETGLIWLLQGRPVVALTDRTAAIQNSTGAITVYRKDNKPALGPLGDGLDDLASQEQ